MFMSFIKPDVRTFETGFTVSRRPVRPVPTSLRAEHARLMTIAAARRLRALARLREARMDDARYWIACAPAAVAKAASLRMALPPLP